MNTGKPVCSTGLYIEITLCAEKWDQEVFYFVRVFVHPGV